MTTHASAKPAIGPSRSRALFAKAKQYIPYGVNSNFRYWGDEHTPIMQRGEGAHLWDADGKRFIDYRLGFGPIILGHAYPAVTQAVAQAIQSGVLFAATTPIEIELARCIRAVWVNRCCQPPRFRY